MQKFALGLAAWSALLLVIAGFAALASPPSGPPMPRDVTPRAASEALVPERDVRAEEARRAPRPAAMSGTVAPVSPPDPSSSSTPSGEAIRASGTPGAVRPVDPAGTAPPSPRRQDEGSVPGLGVLPAGVPAEEEGFGLHVKRADGRPAIDAAVRWLLQRDLDALRADGVEVDRLHPADLLAHATRTARTTSGGFAMLSSEAGTMVMDARLGDEYAWHVAKREEASHARVTMSRITALRVRVADATGASLERIPVVLRGPRCETIWSAVSDASGLAELRFADAVVRAAHARHADLTVSVDVPGGDVRTLPRGEIPVEPVDLRAAPGRTVTILVRDAGGAPCTRPTTVRLAPAGMWIDCGAARVRETTDGRVEFTSVPGGLELVARVDTRCTPAPIEVAVRTHADRDVEVAAVSPVEMPRASGRLVDPRAGAWREYGLRAFAVESGEYRALDETRTDAEGRFEIDVPDLAGATRPVEIVLVARNGYGRAAASAPIVLAPGEGSRRALGDVVASDWPALARGLVVDENEAPLPGAVVESCDVHGAPDPRTRVVADERGGFVLRGPASAGDEVRVRAVEPEGRSAEALVTLRRGETRARIVIAVHGRLEGRVVVPMGAPEGSVLVRVVQPSGAVLALSVDAGGHFAFSNVEPGELRVSFAPLGFEEPVLVLDRVVVPRGAPSSDPRLGHVDLTQVVRVLELEVVDERGQPIESGWAGAVMDEPGRPRGRPYEMTDGVARIVVPRGIPVQVSAHGCRPVVLDAPAGRVRVEMRPEDG